ncbi:MAG TPA: amidase family protein, partial [Jatrophihabitantaceae bacterium]
MTDAWATAEAIRTGATTAEAQVSAALDRIAAGDGEINAFTVVRSDAALAVARDVDAGRRSGPLAGVPVSIKDHV